MYRPSCQQDTAQYSGEQLKAIQIDTDGYIPEQGNADAGDDEGRAGIVTEAQKAHRLCIAHITPFVQVGNTFDPQRKTAKRPQKKREGAGCWNTEQHLKAPCHPGGKTDVGKAGG